MRQRSTLLPGRAAAWLLGFALLLTGFQAAAQQDPPGRVGRLNLHQGAVSFSPAGDDSWYEVVPNRPLTTGDRLWTDRNARAELYVGSSAVRLDEQTSITLSEIDDDTARITAAQGSLQVRVRDDLAGQRVEVDTGNLAVVIDAPGDYRIETDPASDTTRVAVATGRVTLYGEGGESMPLGAHQQITTSGRNLAAANGAPVRPAGEFDRWVAERDRIEDQSISARYVSRDVVGYQQLDAYGDWQSDPDYGNVWYPRGVDAEWAPYRDGQWVDVAPWGWTWIDAAPWGFAPAHYGRWARIGPRWGWVPGRPHARPIYSPAVVGFVGGGANPNLPIPGGRHGVGWFPLAPGEAWRPGYHASQRYIDEANRAALMQRRGGRSGYANPQTPGAVTIVPTDVFGRGPVARRDVIRVPPDRLVSVPMGMGAPVPLRGDRPLGPFGRPATMMPPPAFQARQQQQFQQAQQMQQAQQQIQQAQRQQMEVQQRAAVQSIQAQQAQQAQQFQNLQRQQQEVQQRAASQAVQAQQLQQAQRQQQEIQQRAAAQAMQAQQAQQLQQQALRQQQENQQRAAQAQAQQMQQIQQQQQQALRQQQEMQQRAAQAQAQQMQQIQQQQALRVQQQVQAQQQMQAAQQQMLQAQQAQQQQAIRQAQEVQQRALQAQQQQRQQRSGLPGRDPNQQPDRP
ncbi:chromosome partitioning protein ParA [Variovorax sp. J22R24]|uniref:DUF6600 domain-containing protein n=1 Tax=Variovorax gracilis TaxID=3053502 RepID=UPI0025752C5D|nr:DUF6600 domain-containing protein [Variovorax sp. J22R24]MDM0106905.1 chromosome partitioning protein ParA [Variovorax sp. J22R24]